MEIRCSESLLNSLYEYCRSCYPQEACGFVIGDKLSGGTTLTVRRFAPIGNSSPFPNDRFDMNPAELAALLVHTPQERLLGIYHSHPHAPPIPSELDLQTAWHTLPTYWIVSLCGPERPETAIYRWLPDDDKQKRLHRIRGSLIVTNGDD
ncbi:M67 family metallopeptidase [Paenibacillus chartarius]|uniref:M67 family metallopeptidase n=1 Tax=Paenibacillus chartarius TaxID=747481 RepID=A0ABV6DMA0_9BACL